RQFT
ncbi:Late transcription factor VLTF-4 (1), partial [Monkeypox virus]